MLTTFCRCGAPARPHLSSLWTPLLLGIVDSSHIRLDTWRERYYHSLFKSACASWLAGSTCLTSAGSQARLFFCVLAREVLKFRANTCASHLRPASFCFIIGRISTHPLCLLLVATITTIRLLRMWLERYIILSFASQPHSYTCRKRVLMRSKHVCSPGCRSWRDDGEASFKSAGTYCYCHSNVYRASSALLSY